MYPELAEIKQVRRKLELTQATFAQQVGVSQSLIAKIEAGRLDPSYSVARKIFSAIDLLGKKQEQKASQLMTKHIISVKPNDDIREAIQKMKKANISQMPVIEDHKSIGLISEATILEALLNKKGSRIKDIMDDPAPIIPTNTTISAASNLLRYCPMVLVSESGEIKGVITKADLLGKAFG